MKTRISSKFLARINKLDYLVVVIIVSSVFVRLMTPSMINLNYDYDDFLGVRIANSLLNGNWLGSWDNRTLAKPPGYSFFLALSYWLHIDPVLGIHILYIGISFYFLMTVRKLFSSSKDSITLRVGLFFLLFNPTIYAADFSRVYRTSLNSLAAFAMAAILINMIGQMHERNFKISTKKISIYSLAIGITYCILILTRSEGYWILFPSILAVLYIFFIGIKRDESKNRILHITALSVIIVGFLAGSLIPSAVVKSINKHVYGVALTENYYSGEFARALKIWSGVHPLTVATPFVFISGEQRQKVYEVSPTAKKMEQYLEKPYDPNVWSWKTNNCSVTGICDESGSWLTWDIRDAAISGAGISSEVEFQSYFKKVADEVSSACEAGIIKCSKGGLLPGTKNLSLISKKQLIGHSVKALSTFPSFTQSSNFTRPLIGGEDPYYLSIWESTVRTSRVVTSSDNDLWKSFGHVQEFLNKSYSSLGFLSIFAFVFACSRTRISKESKSIVVPIAFTTLSLLLFSGGVAFFEISSGFGQALALYTIPAQPIFMILTILLTVDLTLFFRERIPSVDVPMRKEKNNG